MPPDLSIESLYDGVIAGVDEAGRGPLAGPVVAAAVVLDIKNIPKGLDDSKKLSFKQREVLFEHIVETSQIGIGQASVKEIDEINILNASYLAMERAVKKLAVIPTIALVDGNKTRHSLPCRHECIIKGDGRSLSIAAASIIAKVTRDRIMLQLAEKHQYYGWHTNVGYGTREHMEAITKYGITEEHRKTFAPIKQMVLI